ncbi:hypothetical protein [Moraxella marmotae]|uniref:hypothetical protein n=1 Tax=Moraxella marmotae TaxID=3344520 RepID=UPI0035F3A7C3
MRKESKNKYEQYERLILRKNIVIFTFPTMGLLIWLSVVRYFDIENVFIHMMILFSMQILMSAWFRKIDKCPWCGNSFFLFKKDGSMAISFIFTQKNV